MFSGIVEAVGEVTLVEARGGGVTLTVRVPAPLRGLEPGASVAVNGVCLTVTGREEDLVRFDAVGATLKRTLLGKVGPGAPLNLERSLRLGDRLDGHLVTGHCDGVGTVTGRRPGEGAVFFEIRAPRELCAQIVPRGSVAVDGISLTVAEVRGTVFTVSIVPYTLRETTMGTYRPGTAVHLETDVLAKYVGGFMSNEAGRERLAAWFGDRENGS